MQGIGEAIKYLYQQFILRDVVAYVAPGTVIAACLLRVYLGGLEPAVNFIRAIPTIAYVPIYGLLFTMGLGIQHLGEMIKVLKNHDRKNDEDRFINLQRFHRAVLLGHVDQSNDYAETMERTRERIEVKKYACGNIAIAIVMGTILILLAKSFPNGASWAILVTGAILVGSLLLAHRHHMKHVKIWENGAIEPRKE
ncbi:MAG TPA: hypothetical protein VGQ41_01350 [Pyrinomonadaceae bacterium]|jgi:hypothetical protein|nr:hypothetical protein [Pyrinomonadaceae bacterium]